MMLRTTLVAVVLLTLAATASGQSFAVSDFRDTSGFTYVNIPSLAPTLELTRDGHLRPTVGAIWRRERVPITRAWSSAITFQILDTGGAPDPSGRGGADGLAFVIQLESNEASGTSGYGIGYHGIRGGIAVEVDTWDDSDEPSWAGYSEDRADHIAVQSNGVDPISAVPGESLLAASRLLSASVSDGLPHTLTIRYDPGSNATPSTLSVYLDDCAMPVLVVPVTLRVLLDATTAYIGITAATQSAYERHRILSWCYSATATNCGCASGCVPDTVYLPSTPDTVIVDRIVRDTIERVTVRVDTLWNEQPPDTVTVVEVRTDSVVIYRDRVDTAYVVAHDTLRIVEHDTTRLRPDTIYVRHVDTSIVYRDTCFYDDDIIRIDSAICAWQSREFMYQSGVTLRVRPNPARDRLTFDVESPGDWRLSVYDAWGILNHRTESTSSHSIDVDCSDWPNGFYTAVLASGDYRRVVTVIVRR